MRVLYIVGVGRSGSTLLERMLGAVPGSVNAGEVNAIFTRVAAQNQLCGCGEPFADCPFWVAVGERAFGGWGPVTERMSDLQPRLVRQRHIPRLATGRLSADFATELDEYLDVHHRLYRAIGEVSGAEVIIDASKSTAQLFALRRIPGLDLRVLNLVRDARGVANSWTKTGLRKPASTAGETMGTYSPQRLAVLWAALQWQSTYLGAAASHSARVRYEDLVDRPLATVAQALSDIGLPPEPGALAHVGERSVRLAASHGVAGSRTRFTHGDIELSLDDAWRATLPSGARRVVTAVTLPQLWSYGYLRARPGPAKATL